MDRNPKTRFGAEGAARPQDQPYFRGVNWDNILASHPAPWRPTSDEINKLPDVPIPKDHPAMRSHQ